MAAVPGFKSQHQSSSAAPFLTLPIISSTCQHFRILSALLGCHSKSGQVWPHSMEPIFSKLSWRHCNQGEFFPSNILGGSHSHLPGSKHSHSDLTYLWNQLKVVKWPCQGLSAKLLLYKTALNGPAPCVPSPSSDWGVRTSYIFFSNISWTPWVLDPITNSYLGHLPPPLGCTLLYSQL